MIETGIDDGAEIVAGGDSSKFERGYFVEPTVLVNARHGTSIATEEIFGPVVCPIPFRANEDFVAFANDSKYGLSAGIFTRDLERAHRTAALIRAGTVWVNMYNVNDPGIPFGGYEESGWGRDMGKEAVTGYLETKSVSSLILQSATRHQREHAGRCDSEDRRRLSTHEARATLSSMWASSPARKESIRSSTWRSQPWRQPASRTLVEMNLMRSSSRVRMTRESTSLAKSPASRSSGSQKPECTLR